MSAIGAKLTFPLAASTGLFRRVTSLIFVLVSLILRPSFPVIGRLPEAQKCPKYWARSVLSLVFRVFGFFPCILTTITRTGRHKTATTTIFFCNLMASGGAVCVSDNPELKRKYRLGRSTCAL